MRVLRGSTIERAIRVKQSDVDSNRLTFKVDDSENTPTNYASADSFIAILDMLFSPLDGDYFIKGENSFDHEGERYKVFFIEDKEGENHTIFFLIEK